MVVRVPDCYLENSGLIYSLVKNFTWKDISHGDLCLHNFLEFRFKNLAGILNSQFI